MTRRRNIFFLILIIGIYLALTMVFFITRPLSIMEGEEFRALSMAQSVFQLIFNQMNLAWFHQPINTIILKFLYYDSHISIVILRSFYLILGVISIVYMNKILILLKNDYIATVLTLLYSLNPLILFYGTSIQSYIVVTLFFLIHIYYLFIYLNNQKWIYLTISLVFLNFVLFTNVTAVFYSIVLMLFFIVNYRLRSKQMLVLILFFMPIAFYFFITFVFFNQLSAFNHTTKYLYFHKQEMFFFLKKCISVAYSSPHWLIPVIVVVLASYRAVKIRHKFSEILLFLNLSFIIIAGASFSILYFNDLGYFTVRHWILLVPIFFMNLLFVFKFIENKKIQFGGILIFSFAMIVSSYNIYKNNQTVDYTSLDGHLRALIKENDALFFVPEFIQLPVNYEVLKVKLNNLYYDTRYVHYVFFNNKKIFLTSMDHPDACDRDVEFYFFGKKFIETIYRYHCNLKLNKIWIIFPKERLFGVYHINYELLEKFLTNIPSINNNIHIKPVVLTDTFDIFGVEVEPQFCF